MMQHIVPAPGAFVAGIASRTNWVAVDPLNPGTGPGSFSAARRLRIGIYHFRLLMSLFGSRAANNALKNDDRPLRALGLLLRRAFNAGGDNRVANDNHERGETNQQREKRIPMLAAKTQSNHATRTASCRSSRCNICGHRPRCNSGLPAGAIDRFNSSRNSFSLKSLTDSYPFQDSTMLVACAAFAPREKHSPLRAQRKFPAPRRCFRTARAIDGSLRSTTARAIC
jgi:hypothetical protein